MVSSTVLPDQYEEYMTSYKEIIIFKLLSNLMKFNVILLRFNNSHIIIKHSESFFFFLNRQNKKKEKLKKSYIFVICMKLYS